MRWIMPAFAFADTSRCYSIKDQDSKNLCLAREEDEKSRCYSVKDSDMKNQGLPGF